MKQLSELKLTRHQKAWLKIHARKFNWTIERIHKRLENQLGEDIDPDSVREFVEENRRLPVSVTKFSKRSMAERQVKATDTVYRQLEADSGRAERGGDFDPKNLLDGRERVVRAINLRRGQAKFRKELLEAYSGRCAITGCDCADALEAAHILPYNGGRTNHVQNGLLLRSDIHTLFDLGRIGIDASVKKVLIAKSLRKTAYGALKDLNLRLPVLEGHHPNEEVLRKHAEQWGLKVKPQA